MTRDTRSCAIQMAIYALAALGIAYLLYIVLR